MECEECGARVPMEPLPRKGDIGYQRHPEGTLEEIAENTNPEFVQLAPLLQTEEAMILENLGNREDTFGEMCETYAKAGALAEYVFDVAPLDRHLNMVCGIFNFLALVFVATAIVPAVIAVFTNTHTTQPTTTSTVLMSIGTIVFGLALLLVPVMLYGWLTRRARGIRSHVAPRLARSLVVFDPTPEEIVQLRVHMRDHAKRLNKYLSKKRLIKLIQSEKIGASRDALGAA